MKDAPASRSDLVDWRPEDQDFWESTGKRVAYRNLWLSVPALLCGFAVWGMWGIITVQMLNLGFPFTQAELFTLTAIAGLMGATFRIPASFFIRLAGGRNTIFLTSTLLIVRKHDFFDLLSRHAELSEALLRLNCRRLRLMFASFEDLNTRPLSARLAKQVLHLSRSYGISYGEEIRIGLQLAQEDLAQLVGASRQRVNQELKGFEREGAVRVEPTRLVVLSREKLMAIAER